MGTNSIKLSIAFLLGIVLILTTAAILTPGMQQPLRPGEALDATLNALITKDSEFESRIVTLENMRVMPFTPTEEALVGTFTATPIFANTTNTPTRTVTSTQIVSETQTPSDALCSVRTNDALTKRQTPGVDGTRLGTLADGTIITIYPLSSTISSPNQSSDYAWWYVRIVDDDANPYNDAWIAYAKTIAPRLTVPGVTPIILESYFDQIADGDCYPSVYGLAPAPTRTPTPIPTITPTLTQTPIPQSNTYPFTVSGNRIFLNGEPFKYVGVNFRELIGYDNVIMPYASPADIVTQLDGAKSIGMRVVRFYVAHRSLTVEQAIPRVKRILDLLKERDMFAILVLTDGAYSGFEIADDFANRHDQIINRYTHDFFGGGYKRNYLPYVERMSAATGNHPAIFAYEIGNEFTTVQVPPTRTQMEDFILFYTDVSATIRKNAPLKLISSGLESCYQLFVLEAYDNGRYCVRLYDIVDIGTLHSYQSSNDNPLGSSYMHIIREMEIPNQPLILEEVNTFWENETSDWLAMLVKTIFNRLTGIMHWNMSWPHCKNIGVGDGAWNACPGSAQARRWFHITGFYRSLADQLRLQY